MTEKEPKITLATASLLPLAAVPPFPVSWQESTADMAKFGEEIAANAGLEVLATKRTIFELKKHHRLDAAPEKVASLHVGWKNDRRRSRKFGIQDDLMTKAGSLLLPPEEKSDKNIEEMQQKYNARTVFHWVEDTAKYKKPTLEVHELVGKINKDDKTWSVEQIINWVKEDPDNRKLALDISIRKLFRYCESQGITKPEEVMKVMEQLLPYAGIIHFQAGEKEELDAIWKKDKNSDLAKLTRLAKKIAPDAEFVIELNTFPKIFFASKFHTKEFFRRAVQFIKEA